MNWGEKVIQTSEWAQFILKLLTSLVWWIALFAFLSLMQLVGWTLGRVKPKPPPTGVKKSPK